MTGSATLTIEPSSVAMKLPKATAEKAIQGERGRSMRGRILAPPPLPRHRPARLARNTPGDGRPEAQRRGGLGKKALVRATYSA
jgi:hypothetical protein